MFVFCYFVTFSANHQPQQLKEKLYLPPWRCKKKRYKLVEIRDRQGPGSLHNYCRTYSGLFDKRNLETLHSYLSLDVTKEHSTAVFVSCLLHFCVEFHRRRSQRGNSQGSKPKKKKKPQNCQVDQQRWDVPQLNSRCHSVTDVDRAYKGDDSGNYFPVFNGSCRTQFKTH